jgi:hypothetical protein
MPISLPHTLTNGTPADATEVQDNLEALLDGINDSELQALAALVSAANKLPYFTGAGVAALTDLSAFARTLLDDASAAAARTTLGAVGVSGTGAETTLRVLRGTVAADGTIQEGTGFSISKGAAGIYTIDFTTDFSDVASLVATCLSASYVAGIDTQAAGQVVLNIKVASTLALADQPFNFIAIGPA